MRHNENNLNIPDRYRLIDETTFSFLWFQAAEITLHYLGAGTIQPVGDAERIDFVERLGRLYLENDGILPEIAQLVMDRLIGAATDLTEGGERQH